MAGKRLNTKFVIILTAILVVVGFLAFLMLHIQSSRQIETCYQMGLTAFENQAWAEAVTNLGPVADKLKNDDDRVNAIQKLAQAQIHLLEQTNKSVHEVEAC